MKKIAYIISDIDKAVYFEQTALSLRDQGLDVTYILINCTKKQLHVFLEENGFEVFSFEIVSLSRSRKVVLACKAILKKSDIDLVHCHLAQANWIGLRSSRLAGVKCRIYTRHSGAPLKLGWKEKIIDKIQNRLATHIVAISKNIDDLLSDQGVSSSKRRLIHHGFDLNHFGNHNVLEIQRIKKQYNPTDQYPVIGVIARWMDWKGIQYTIEAFKKLLVSHPNALICLFGATSNANYSTEINQLLAEIPDQNKCVEAFESNVYDLYQLFDVYVHVPVNPSCEAFGQTYIEALASGIPSVFTLSGVAREFIQHEKNALVVPFKNSDEIHRSILQLLENTESKQQMITNGKNDIVQLFNFELYIQKLIDLYGEDSN